MQFVGGPGLRTGVLLAWQQRGQADRRRGQPIALQDALDGPFAGKRSDAEARQFRENRWGPDQAVTCGRRGMGLGTMAEGEDSSLQFGWETLGAEVAGPRQVVEPLGPGFQVAMPPLAEPDFGAAERGTDGLDGPAGETQGNGALTRREFVVLGYLRVAAAGGCPRG
jgi:hypothetical protein